MPAGWPPWTVVPPYLAREVADAIPVTCYEEIERCGHFGYLERPAEATRSTREILCLRVTSVISHQCRPVALPFEHDDRRRSWPPGSARHLPYTDSITVVARALAELNRQSGPEHCLGQATSKPSGPPRSMPRHGPCP